MNRQHVFDSFQLYDQAITHNKIESQARIQANIVVDYREHDLPFDFDPLLVQFVDQAYFIHTFQQTGTEGIMDRIRRIHNLLGYRVS